VRALVIKLCASSDRGIRLNCVGLSVGFCSVIVRVRVIIMVYIVIGAVAAILASILACIVEFWYELKV
jgi:hypothetical protein